jgi:hypothetical protein
MHTTSSRAVGFTVKVSIPRTPYVPRIAPGLTKGRFLLVPNARSPQLRLASVRPRGKQRRRCTLQTRDVAPAHCAMLYRCLANTSALPAAVKASVARRLAVRAVEAGARCYLPFRVVLVELQETVFSTIVVFGFGHAQKVVTAIRSYGCEGGGKEAERACEDHHGFYELRILGLDMYLHPYYLRHTRRSHLLLDDETLACCLNG